jgi:hypothetical protein
VLLLNIQEQGAGREVPQINNTNQGELFHRGESRFNFSARVNKLIILMFVFNSPPAV